jgi:hypothetical protein
MRRLKTFAVVLAGLTVVAAGIAASAFAATMTLPEFTTKTGWTGKSGAGKLGASGVEVKCSAGTNSGTMEASKKLGTFVITFTGCESPLLGKKCNSVGDAAETILTEGSWHLVLTTISGADKHLVWFLVKELEVECGTVKIKVRGNVLGEITPANTLTKVYSLKVAVGANKKQEFTTFENDSGENVAASLRAETGGIEAAATEESAGNVLTTTEDTLIIN